MIRLQKRTRYALYAVMAMAEATDREPVTAMRIAERYSIPATVVAKVLQHLVRAGIAVGTRGLGGGYHLAAKPSEVTVLDVVEAFESPRSVGPGSLGGRAASNRPDSPDCGLSDLFDEVDELVRCTFASVTVETLLRRRHPDRSPGDGKRGQVRFSGIGNSNGWC